MRTLIAVVLCFLLVPQQSHAIAPALAAGAVGTQLVRVASIYIGICGTRLPTACIDHRSRMLDAVIKTASVTADEARTLIAYFFTLLPQVSPDVSTPPLDVHASCEELIAQLHKLNRHSDAEQLRSLCGLKQPQRSLGFSQRCNTIVRFVTTFRDRVIEDAVKKFLEKHRTDQFFCLSGNKHDKITTFLYAMLFARDKQRYRSATLHVRDGGLVIDLTKRDGSRVLCTYALASFFHTDALFCGTPLQLERTVHMLIKNGLLRDKRVPARRVIEALVPDRL
jgi:hypothetical protein